MRVLRILPCAAIGLVAASSAAAPPKPKSPATPPPTSAPNPTSTPPSTSTAAATSKMTAPTPPPASKPIELKLPIEKATLDNGLRVVMSVDHTSPTIAVDILYDVGGRNEERGHSGFAHLFEHMMFQGSANVARGEHFKLVTSHGGQLNGTTSEDRTRYFELMPRSELPLALWLEADRMKSLDISQKNFENQRSVVQEEFRMRVGNAAYIPAEIRLEELIFQGYFPYEHPAIGNMRDLDAAQLEWVRAFHDAYYAPNDAVLSIAGDFDPDEAKALATRFFGNAQRHEIPKYDPGPMPEQTAPRDAVVEDAHAKLPALMYGWAIPPSNEPDHYALQMAASLLADGESSRLYQLLVRDRAVAIEVDADTDRHRGPDAFEIIVKLSERGSLSAVAGLVDAEIARLARTAPSAAEMQKLYNRTQAHYVMGLQSNLERADRIAQFELFRGDANLVNLELGRYLSVTAEDIRRVVAKYLTKAHRSRVEDKPAPPEAKPAEAKPPAAKPHA